MTFDRPGLLSVADALALCAAPINRGLFLLRRCGYNRCDQRPTAVGMNRMINVPQQQIPGVYHRRVGDIVVTAISDGFLDGSLDVLRNITADEARQILTDIVPPGAPHARQCLPDLLGRPPRADRDRIGQLSAAHGRQGAGQPQGRRRRSGRHRDGAPDAHASRTTRRA